MSTSWSHSRTGAQLRETSLLAASFFLLASASITLTRFDGGAAFLWPATAPLFAFLAMRHPRTWLLPLVATGAASLLASTLFGIGAVGGFPLALAIVGEAVVSASILRYFEDDLSCFDSIPSVGKFVLAAGIVAPALSGVIGAAVISLHTGHGFWPNWWAWFAAHSLGTVSIAPLLLLFMRGEGWLWLRTANMSQRAEALGLLLMVAATSYGVFAQQKYPLLFLPMLPLIFTTFRLGRLGAASAVVLVAVIGGIETLLGRGPISLMDASAGERAQFFQFYLAIAVMLVLPAAAELRQREALMLRIRQTGTAYRLLSDNLGDTLIHTSVDGDVLYASPAIFELTGYDADRVVGRNSRDFVLPDDYAAFTAARDAAIEEPERTIDIQYRAKIQDDVVIWCETRMRSYTDERGTPAGVILAVRNVTARKAAEAELALEATTDVLTGLPNRRLFLSRLLYLQQEVASGQAAGCVAILDVDHFKRINDTHGHVVGDWVLAQTAKVVQGALRSGDMVARVGGEEFAIVFWGASLANATMSCERVRVAIEKATVLTDSGRKIHITASVGIAEIRPDSEIEEAYGAADRALYQAKTGGRNRLSVAG